MSQIKPICSRCNQYDGIMDGEVSQISLCLGPGLSKVWTAMLCSKCATELHHRILDMQTPVKQKEVQSINKPYDLEPFEHDYDITPFEHELISKEKMAWEVAGQAQRDLRNLLAVIHEDDGSYLKRHGSLKAIADGHKRIARERDRLRELEPLIANIVEHFSHRTNQSCEKKRDPLDLLLLNERLSSK